MKKLIFMVLLALVSCDIYKGSCDSNMASVRSQYGEPEEVNALDNGANHTVEWWYWTKGVEYTFSWGSAYSGCDVTKYTFDPITATATAAVKATARASRTFVSRQVNVWR